MGAYKNRMLIVASVLFLPFTISLQFVDHIFVAMGVDKLVAEQAAIFVRIASIGVYLYIQTSCYQNIAISMGKTHYVLFSTVGASILHWVLCPILVIKLDWKM